MAKIKMPNINFINTSVIDLQNIEFPKYDFCVFLGVMPIFDNIESIMRNLISVMNNTVALYILDSINNDPVDVIMSYKISSENSEWQSGFNIRSEKSYGNILRTIDARLKYRFYPFNIKFPIKKTEDPMRAWTIKTGKSNYQQIVETG